MKYLLQKEFVLFKEKNIIKYSGKCDYTEVSINDLKLIDNKNSLIPIGSVEFVRKYCELNHILLPNIKCYPDDFSFLNRKISVKKFSEVLDYEFVKPQRIKAFTGNIKSRIDEPVNSNELCWVSEPLTFDCEFRVYILNNKIIGYSQYDDSEDSSWNPSEFAEKILLKCPLNIMGYSIDVGLVDGKETLIEFNDGWSLGFYNYGTMTEKSYIDLITARWIQILANAN